MYRTINSLDFYVYGDKQVSFGITTDGVSKTYFGDVAATEGFTENLDYSHASTYDYTNGHVVHSLYDVTKARLKTPVYSKSKSSISGLESDFVDVYAPSLSGASIIGMVGIEDYQYCLTTPMTKSIAYPYVSLSSKMIGDYTYGTTLSSSTIPTYLYEPITELCSNYNSYDGYIKTLFRDNIDDGLNRVFEVKNNLLAVNYNYILEFQLGKIRNIYDEGMLFCDPYVGKNHYTAEYTVSASTDTAGKFVLDDCRDYCGIGCGGGQVFLKYTDDKRYVEDSRVDTPYTNINGKPITEVTMKQQAVHGRQFNFQHIEVLKSMNRFSPSNQHKSNIYSLELVDTGLNDNSNIAESIKEKLRQDVKNMVRDMAEQICPADTQLFEVYFSGK